MIILIILLCVITICFGLYLLDKKYSDKQQNQTIEKLNVLKNTSDKTYEQIKVFALSYFDKFEDKYLVYSKRNENRFIMNKLIGQNSFYIYRLRKNDLDILFDNYMNQYHLAREMMHLMERKQYVVDNIEHCDVEDKTIKNPTIIKIIIKI